MALYHSPSILSTLGRMPDFDKIFLAFFVIPLAFFRDSRYNRGIRRTPIPGKEDMLRMSEEYGPDFISVTDDEGNEFELEHLGTLEYKGNEYMAFVPADMDEDDEDFGLILLRVIEQDGEQLLADIDDEQELNEVYEQFMAELFEDEEGE